MFRFPARSLCVLIFISFGVSAQAEIVLSWDELRARLDGHPALAAAQAEVAAADGARRAIALPNPELELGAGTAQALTADETADTWELGLAIDFRPWGPYRLERRAAGALRESAERDLHATRLELERELASRFWGVAHDQQLLKLLERRHEQVDRIAEVARLRAELGETRPTDPLRLEIELERVNDELRQASLEAKARSRGLALWLDLDPTADFRVNEDTDDLPALPDLERLSANLNDHPTLVAAALRRDAAAAGHGAARAARLPGIELGAFVEREMDAETHGVRASLEIPLFNMGGGAVAQSAAELALAEHGRDLLERSLREALLHGHARTEYLRARVLSYRDVILPRQHAAVDAFERFYKVGEESLLELLAARHDLAAAETELLAARYEYRLALAELATLAGGIDHD
jgi:outer membrane protein TolC